MENNCERHIFENGEWRWGHQLVQNNDRIEAGAYSLFTAT